MLDSIFYTAYGLELVAILVTIAAVASFLIITLSERSEALEVLRGLGATRSQLVTSFVLEAIVVGLLGAALGCSLGRVPGQVVVLVVAAGVSALSALVVVRSVEGV